MLWLPPAAICAALAAGVAYQLVQNAQHPFSLDLLLLAFNILLGGLLGWLCAASPARYERAIATALLVLVAGGFLWGSGRLSLRWHRDFWTFYQGRLGADLAQWLGRLDPAVERICVCEYRYYPCFGSRRQFDVCRPLWLPDRAAFMRYLERYQITVLVARKQDPFPQGRYAHVMEWIDQSPDLFRPLHDSTRYIMARVNHGQLAPAPAKRGKIASERLSVTGSMPSRKAMGLAE